MNLLLAIAVTGATYSIQWDKDHWRDDLHLTGTVDTTTYTITWDSLPADWETPLTWSAWTAGEVIRPEGEVKYHEIVPYDVPDDWSGVMGDWAFISEHAYFSYDMWQTHIYQGLGGSLWTSNCSLSKRPWWNCNGGQWLYPNGDILRFGGATAELVEIQPVSPTRIIGDANYDGAFNSTDMVRVFTAGKYGTGEPAYWSEGDWDQDGVFDSGDMVAAFTAGGYERPLAAVPEPSATILALLGLLYLGGSHVTQAVRRQRRGQTPVQQPLPGVRPHDHLRHHRVD